ncbi:MAG: pilus assembly protein TadG-related protein, partial [Anaerolineales bacterium]|nr:pilus assembly protein TadG-related protein [Anaerolineales bacterium]
MVHRKTERGQALILITLAMIGLIALTGLTVDGGMAYSDRRNAQNAADSAAFAAALAHSRGQNVTNIGQGVALTNGFNNDGTTNTVAITVVNSPSGVCPAGATNNKDITVEITSVTNTTFANVVGVQQVTNVVSATTRSCGTYIAPIFDGNAIV